MKLVHIIIILAFAFTGLLLQACPPLGNSDMQEVAARVNNIVIADTAIVGHLFPVVIHSQGANGCWQAGGVRIEKTSSGWRLQPYDYAYHGDAMCTMALVDFHHQVNLDFTRPGQREVEIVRGSWTDDSTSTDRYQVVVIAAE
jgi:hypothetical protein